MSEHRKRLKRREVPGQARYLTWSCRHRLPLFGNDAIKQAFRDQLASVHANLPFKLLAWAVMPEHIHLLVLPEDGLPIAALSSAIKRPLAARVLRRWRELDAPVLNRITDANQPRFWQPGGGYDRNIFSEDERAEKTRYIHLNPVRRGLVSGALDWPWSSARAYRKLDHEPPYIDPHYF